VGEICDVTPDLTFESIRKAKDQLLDYIEVFYNQRRRHSSSGYVSPAQHEN
jgi:putative transposase